MIKGINCPMCGNSIFNYDDNQYNGGKSTVIKIEMVIICPICKCEATIGWVDNELRKMVSDNEKDND